MFKKRKIIKQHNNKISIMFTKNKLCENLWVVTGTETLLWIFEQSQYWRAYRYSLAQTWILVTLLAFLMVGERKKSLRLYCLVANWTKIEIERKEEKERKSCSDYYLTGWVIAWQSVLICANKQWFLLLCQQTDKSVYFID